MESTLIPFITILIYAVITYFAFVKRYTLTHVVMLEGGTLKNISTTGFPTKKRARREMQKQIDLLTNKGGENCYYTSLTGRSDWKQLVIQDVIHCFEIQKL